MSFMDFSSWPRDQEQTFVVYEQHTAESSKKALMGGIIAGVAFFVLALGVYAGVEPDKRDMTKGMNMDNLSRRKKAAAEPAPTPTPAPAAAPAADPPKAEAAPAEPAAAPAENK